jgi:hypothetical protein
MGPHAISFDFLPKIFVLSFKISVDFMIFLLIKDLLLNAATLL